jgi:hypothetical protein
VEGHPDHDHPLRGEVLPIVLTVLEFYRIRLNARELRLYNVAEPLIPLYESFGFILAPELGHPHHMRKGYDEWQR